MALIQFKFLHGIKINFLKFKYITIVITSVITFVTIFSIFKNGINYGVDFKGGHIIEVKTSDIPNLSKIRNDLENLKIGDVSIQQIGKDPKDLSIKIERKNNTDNVEAHLEKIKSVLGPNTEYRKTEIIGPKVGQELIKSAIKSIIIALGCMLIYIAVRFQWQYAISAIISLLHDCIGVLALFTLFKYDFNESAIIAILITAGYSINDTIIIFDRIRENMALKKYSIQEVINVSINETLSRTTLTVAATLLSLFAMYYFGGKVISEFSMPIIIGILIGTYSSIFISAPLLLFFGLQLKTPNR